MECLKEAQQRRSEYMASVPFSIHFAEKVDDPMLDRYNKEVEDAWGDVRHFEQECNERIKSFLDKLFGR